MKKYKFISQKKENYCTPACLQMVLERNGFDYDSQQKILEECGNKIRIPSTINNYFKIKDYSLYCFDFIFNLSYHREFEKLIEEALTLDCDILVGYAWEILHKTDNQGDHLSILYAYNPKNTLDITLIDPAIKSNGIFHCDFNKLIYSIFAVEDGFHIIHSNKQLLEYLAKKYP